MCIKNKVKIKTAKPEEKVECILFVEKSLQHVTSFENGTLIRQNTDEIVNHNCMILYYRRSMTLIVKIQAQAPLIVGDLEVALNRLCTQES